MPSMDPRTTLPGFIVLLALVVQGRCHGATGHDPFYPLSEPVYEFLREVVDHLQSNITSEECQKDFATVLRQVADGKKSALQLFDAMGKPGSGVLEGGVSYPGYFSECVETKIDEHIRGRYCLAQLKFDTGGVSNETLFSLYPKLEVGICVPSSCKQRDVASAVKSAAGFLYHSVEANLRDCYSRSQYESFDWATWFAIGLFSSFLLLAFVGTFLELTIRCTSSQKSIPNGAGVTVMQSVERCTTPNMDHSGAVVTNSSSETLCKDNSRTDDEINLSRLLLSFSLVRNGRKILGTESSEGTLSALHGIRFLSMAWIMIGHSFAFASRWLFFRNPNVMSSAPKDFLSQAFANGTFAVDTFFFLGGFLVAYTLLREMSSTGGRFSILALYAHRYLRMTPVMMIVIAFSSILLKYVGSGPSWREATLMYDEWCRDNWWLNALYIQNFVRTDHMCLSHTWYSAVDMQFYLIAPIIVKLCFRHTYGAIIALALPFVITAACPILYTFVYHLPAVPSDTVPLTLMNDYYRDVYIKPYCRMGPYLVGMALAYIFYRKNFSLQIRKKHLIVGWSMAITTNVGIIYSMGRVFNSDPPTDAESALYNGFARTAWAATIAWMTLTCASGQAGFLNRILSLPVIVPLSRLTYSAYLVHPVLMAIFYGSRETVFDFSFYWLIYLVLGNLVITYIVSFVLSMLFESPILNIEKLYRGKK